ncbi:hypothetical protein EV715DRAFT_288760 [Schizophyllum commune]
MDATKIHTRVSPLPSWYKTYANSGWQLLNSNAIDRVVDHLVNAGDLSLGDEWQWAAMPRKCRGNADEDCYSAGIKTIWQSVLEATEEILPTRFSLGKRTTMLSCRPNNEVYSEAMGQSTRINAISQLRQTVYPEETEEAKPGSAKREKLTQNERDIVDEDAGLASTQPVVYTGDLAMTIHWELEDSAEAISNNEAHAIGAADHIVCNDASRSWHFSITIEKESMRLWCHSRSHRGMSERFNMHSDHRELIQFILFATYASKEQLGFDARTTHVIDDDRRLQYRFKVDHVDSTDPKDDYHIWQTTAIINEHSAKKLFSKGMRVYAVVPVSLDGKVVLDAGERVMRDFWISDAAKREKVIQEDMLEKIKKMLKHGENFDDIKQHFMTFLTEEVVAEAPASPEGSKSYRHANGHDASARVRAGEGVSDESMQDGESEGRLHPHGKVRIRSICGEVCEDMYRVQDPAEFFYALSMCVKILSYLHRAGYLHGDISPGNFLLYHVARDATDVSERFIVKIADLEYATDYQAVSRHDTITGTGHYMAVEVQSRSHLLVPLDQILVPASDFFSYNPYHDLESVMWMALDFIMSRMSLTILREEDWEDLEEAVADMATDATRVFVNNIRGSSARTNLIIEPGPKMDLQEQLEFLYGDASPVTTLLPNLLQDIWLAYSTLQSRSAEHVTNGRFNLVCFGDELYRKMLEAFEIISKHFVDSAEPLVLLSQIDRASGKLIMDQIGDQQEGETESPSPGKRKADEVSAASREPRGWKRSRFS